MEEFPMQKAYNLGDHPSQIFAQMLWAFSDTGIPNAINEKANNVKFHAACEVRINHAKGQKMRSKEQQALTRGPSILGSFPNLTKSLNAAPHQG